MKSVCFLLGAVIVALILPAQAKDRGRSLCASSGPPLPASAAELFKEAEKDYMPGIRIGRALGEAVLPELRQALRSGSVARQRVALYALGELGPGRPQLMAEILPFVTETMYENLVRAVDPSAPVSIHLCDWPEPELGRVDERILAEISREQKRTSRGYSALDTRRKLAACIVADAKTHFRLRRAKCLNQSLARGMRISCAGVAELGHAERPGYAEGKRVDGVAHNRRRQ